MSEPAAVSAQQNTLGPPPVSPSLHEFALSEDDLKRLPRLWFDEFALTASKRFFNTYVVISVVSYVLMFRDSMHLSFGYIFGFFAFAFVFILPFGIFWIVMGAIERKLYITLNSRFARYSRYQDAISAYRRRKVDYDAGVTKQQAEYWRSLSGIAFERELGKLFSRTLIPLSQGAPYDV